jgi:hypothetical protein
MHWLKRWIRRRGVRKLQVKDCIAITATRDTEAIYDWALACAKYGDPGICDPTVADAIADVLRPLVTDRERSDVEPSDG